MDAVDGTIQQKVGLLIQDVLVGRSSYRMTRKNVINRVMTNFFNGFFLRLYQVPFCDDL